MVSLLKEAYLLDESDGGVWLTKARRDRLKEECRIESGFSKGVTLLIQDMIRESGDRGTSVLNYLINCCLFLASLSIMLTEKGMKKATVMHTLDQIPPESHRRRADSGRGRWTPLLHQAADRGHP